MRKSTVSEILWYEPNNNRRQASATFKADGTLCFGKEMCERLEGNKVKIGFLPNECALLIEAGLDSGYTIPKNGQVNLTRMASVFINMDLELPLCFLFEQEGKNTYWQGHIIPPLRKANHRRLIKKPTISGDCAYLLTAYKWLTDDAVRTYAKSTPLDERRAAAQEALLEAFRTYSPINGLLKDFLSQQIKIKLIEQNKQYTKISKYNSFSLDEPIKKDDKTGACKHNIFSFRTENFITKLENKLDLEIFCKKHLSIWERKIFNMLLGGYSVVEITEKFNMTERELDELCGSIGERWMKFNAD